MAAVTIPQKLTKEGELVVIPRKAYEEFLRIAKVIPKDQQWFWTREWQEKEKAADRDIKLLRMSGPYRTKTALKIALKRLKK